MVRTGRRPAAASPPGGGAGGHAPTPTVTRSPWPRSDRRRCPEGRPAGPPRQDLQPHARGQAEHDQRPQRPRGHPGHQRGQTDWVAGVIAMVLAARSSPSRVPPPFQRRGSSASVAGLRPGNVTDNDLAKASSPCDTSSCWSSRLLALASRRPGRGCCRPPSQAWPQLVDHDLDGGPGAAVLSGPCPLLEPAQDHDPAALGQRLGDMLGLVAPHNRSEERRLLLPPSPTPRRNTAWATPPSVCRNSGSSVRLPAKLTLASVMVHPLLGLSGRAVCPSSWNRGPVDAVACRRPPGGKRRNQ